METINYQSCNKRNNFALSPIEGLEGYLGNYTIFTSIVVM